MGIKEKKHFLWKKDEVCEDNGMTGHFPEKK